MTEGACTFGEKSDKTQAVKTKQTEQRVSHEACYVTFLECLWRLTPMIFESAPDTLVPKLDTSSPLTMGRTEVIGPIVSPSRLRGTPGLHIRS